jgi:hypothetical protein
MLKAYFVQISLPSFLSNKSWDIQISKACSGWNFGIRTYITLDENAEVFQTLKRGTLEDLLMLFKTGRATPYTKNPDGWTLLHVSTMILITTQDKILG